MKVITTSFNVYTYDELDDKQKDVAINQLINCWFEDENLIPDDASDLFDKAIAEATRMLTPWFSGEYVWDYCQKAILAELKNGYFRETGRFYGYIDIVNLLEQEN